LRKKEDPKKVNSMFSRDAYSFTLIVLMSQYANGGTNKL